jgi:NADPH-dependent F420 reductase
MKIGIVGGTGNLGSGLAARWSRAGHAIAIGSRDAAKARAHAAELVAAGAPGIEAGDNAWAAAQSEVVVLAVPYAAHGDTLRSIREACAGKPFIDTTVPLRPPKVSRVQLPEGQAAALEAQAILGPATPVAAAFHHVSAEHLEDLTHAIDCDVLVAGDDARAKSVAIELAGSLGLRGLDAGALANAIALESLTPVLIHLNRTYKIKGAGIVLTRVPR